MPCYHPLKGFQGKDGKVRPRDYSGTPMTVPCGGCIGCRMEYARQWTVRLLHELPFHECTCWITLTYNNEHLPADLGLDVTHWQLFAKKLRNRYGPFRFFHCGEYGEATEKNHYIARPHYHACIYGIDFKDDRTFWRNSTPKWNGGTTYPLYRSRSLERIWGRGFVEIGTLTAASCGYTARYITKKINGKDQDKTYLDKPTGVIRRAPYTTMSRRPGIGHAWYQKYHQEVFPLDRVISQGRPARPPKYYDEQLKRDDAEAYEALKKTRREHGEETKEDHTPERLAARKATFISQTTNLKRSL